MTENKPKPQLALLVDDLIPDGSGLRYGQSAYLVSTIRFVLRVGDAIENPRWESYGEYPFKEYVDLEFRAQTDSDHAKRGERFYGWSFSYKSVYEVNYDRAVAMAKTLKRIADKHKESSEFFGSPSDYMSFVLRIAGLLKIRNFARIRKHGGNYQNSEIIWMDADGCRRYVEQKEQEFIDQYREKPAAIVPIGSDVLPSEIVEQAEFENELAHEEGEDAPEEEAQG